MFQGDDMIMKRMTKIMAVLVMSVSIGTALTAVPAEISPVSSVSYAATTKSSKKPSTQVKKPKKSTTKKTTKTKKTNKTDNAATTVPENIAITGIMYSCKAGSAYTVKWDKADGVYCYVVNTYDASKKNMSKYRTIKNNSVTLPKGYEGKVQIIAYSKNGKKTKKVAQASFEIFMESDSYAAYNAVNTPKVCNSSDPDARYSYPLTIITENFGYKATGDDLAAIMSKTNGSELEMVQATLRNYFKQQNSKHDVVSTSNPSAVTVAKELENGNFVIYYDDDTDEMNVIYGYERTEGVFEGASFMFDLFNGNGEGAEVFESSDRVRTQALIVR